MKLYKLEKIASRETAYYRGMEFEVSCSGKYTPATWTDPADYPECQIDNIKFGDDFEEATYFLWELQNQYTEDLDSAIEANIVSVYSEIGSVPSNFTFESVGCRFHVRLFPNKILPKLQQLEQSELTPEQALSSFQLDLNADYDITKIEITNKNVLIASISDDEQNKIIEESNN